MNALHFPWQCIISYESLEIPPSIIANDRQVRLIKRFIEDGKGVVGHKKYLFY